MLDATLHGLVPQEFPDEPGIEVVAVFDVEREVLVGLGALPVLQEPRAEKEPVRVRVHVHALAAREGVEVEGRDRVLVELRGEGVEVALVTRARGLVGEGNAVLVGRVARRHPFGLVDADLVEENLEPRRRTLAHADRAAVRRLDQRDLHTAVAPGIDHGIGGNPAGRATTENNDALFDLWVGAHIAVPVAVESPNLTGLATRRAPLAE